DEVGAREQIIETHALDAGRGECILRDVWIVGEDVKPKRFGFRREHARDIAEANEAQGLALEAAQRHDRRYVPAGRLHEFVGQSYFARERKNERHGVVGDFALAVIRHIVDRDAERLLRRLERGEWTIGDGNDGTTHRPTPEFQARMVSGE